MDVMQKTLMLGSKVKKALKMDGWANVLTGMGTDKDKRTGGQINRKKTWQREVELLHDNDDIAKKVVNEIPDRGTTKWIDHKVGEEEGGIEQANKIVEFEKELLVKKKFKQAWAWARMYGGAGIFISVDDGQELDKPLNLNSISKINSLNLSGSQVQTYAFPCPIICSATS